jgi:hypothetical protein
VLVDIATGIRPAARLKRVIADIRLQLTEVIIHHGPPIELLGEYAAQHQDPSDVRTMPVTI